jgi:[ribosomal protein S18]-alanine N-acetyltransferase
VTSQFNGEGITIRKMEIGDIKAVSLLDQQSFSLPWPQSSFKFEIEQNANSRCWVAEINERNHQVQLVGMLIVWIILDELHIATLAVDANYRRKHIARRLLLKALTEGMEQKCISALLEVRSSNTAAINLYLTAGFKQVGLRKKYYQDNGEDAVLMTLDFQEFTKKEAGRWGKI